VPRKPVDFSSLEQAFWRHVEEQCPHGMNSRHRYTWVRENKRFIHGDIRYERRTSKGLAPSGRPVHVVEFHGSDGSVYEEHLAMGSII